MRIDKAEKIAQNDSVLIGSVATEYFGIAFCAFAKDEMPSIELRIIKAINHQEYDLELVSQHQETTAIVLLTLQTMLRAFTAGFLVGR